MCKPKSKKCPEEKDPKECTPEQIAECHPGEKETPVRKKDENCK